MAFIKKLISFSDQRGSLSVLEIGKEINFDVKRVYYIYDVAKSIVRGGHRHHKNIQALICIKGNCDIFVNNGKKGEVFKLNSPDLCLILNTEDWHKMYNFSQDAVLLVLASEHYDINDYIDEEY